MCMLTPNGRAQEHVLRAMNQKRNDILMRSAKLQGHGLRPPKARPPRRQATEAAEKTTSAWTQIPVNPGFCVLIIQFEAPRVKRRIAHPSFRRRSYAWIFLCLNWLKCFQMIDM